MPWSREEAFNRLVIEPFDVLVIGGGVVGAGVARDAAMRGLKTGLVDTHDFAYGTSSRSSRLLHGGLRYLAQGRIKLVREASREKMVIHRIAPHLAQPLPFVFPTYRGTPWKRWQLRIGVKIYDLLCGKRNLGRSASLNAKQLLEHIRGANPEKLTGAVRYFDGLTNDARLVLDTLRSAEKHGAVLLNYAQITQSEPSDLGWQCSIEDVIDSQQGIVQSRIVVNATGPWGDQLPPSSVKLRRTKGVHLVVPRDRLPVPDAVVMSEGARILFAIPWGERTILGTTDTDFDGECESVRTEQDDIGYILHITNGAFPDANLTQSDVLSSWAGLRPLIAAKGGGPSDISRAHEIHSPQPGWIDVAGGKLTTYRLIAEQTVDRAVKHLGVSAGRCQTTSEPLLTPEEVHGVSGILPPPVGRAPVEHYCQNEWVVHLDDLMIRRTGWSHYLLDADKAAQQVADWMADILGWDSQQKASEWNRYQAAK